MHFVAGFFLSLGMNCIELLPGLNALIQPDNYYEDLLFQQILKDKVITVDSFDKLYFISKNFKITGISDTKGNCSFIGKNKSIEISDEKKKQLKIDFVNHIMITSAQIIIDYD